MKILLTAALLLFLVFIFFNWDYHCPKCRRVFARKYLKKKIVSSKTEEEFGWNAKKGQDTKIKVKYKTVRYDYRCKYCNHKWSQRIKVDG